MGDVRKWPEDKVLGHPTRKAILDMLDEREGGLPATAICNELDEAPGLSTVQYHLRVLCSYEFVVAGGDNTATPVYTLA